MIAYGDIKNSTLLARGTAAVVFLAKDQNVILRCEKALKSDIAGTEKHPFYKQCIFAIKAKVMAPNHIMTLHDFAFITKCGIDNPARLWYKSIADIKKYEKSNICAVWVYDYVPYKFDFKYVYPEIIQLLYVHDQIIKLGYNYNESYWTNIGYRSTDLEHIVIEGYKIPTNGRIVVLLDYGDTNRGGRNTDIGRILEFALTVKGLYPYATAKEVNLVPKTKKGLVGHDQLCSTLLYFFFHQTEYQKKLLGRHYYKTFPVSSGIESKDYRYCLTHNPTDSIKHLAISQGYEKAADINYFGDYYIITAPANDADIVKRLKCRNMLPKVFSQLCGQKDNQWYYEKPDHLWAEVPELHTQFKADITNAHKVAKIFKYSIPELPYGVKKTGTSYHILY